ncbi:MAG: hypothetical protein LBE08_00040 [Bifidobacteriaceae bacterium]|nr:hypothetical protein [Bifidobacteriaceae bacterium]
MRLRWKRGLAAGIAAIIIPAALVAILQDWPLPVFVDFVVRTVGVTAVIVATAFIIMLIVRKPRSHGGNNQT